MNLTTLQRKLTCSLLFWDRINKLFRVSSAKRFLKIFFPSLISWSPHGGSRECRILKWCFKPSLHSKILSDKQSLWGQQSFPAFHASKYVFCTWTSRNRRTGHSNLAAILLTDKHVRHTPPPVRNTDEKLPPPDGGHIGRDIWQRLSRPLSPFYCACTHYVQRTLPT